MHFSKEHVHIYVLHVNPFGSHQANQNKEMYSVFHETKSRSSFTSNGERTLFRGIRCVFVICILHITWPGQTINRNHANKCLELFGSGRQIM